MPRNRILRVVVNTPLRRQFDYLPPQDSAGFYFTPGQRVLVPFGKRERVGLLIATTDTPAIAEDKLKHVRQVLDQVPLFRPDHLKFLLWAAHYYHHPPGEVILGGLPRKLREGAPALITTTGKWGMTPAGEKIDLRTLDGAPRQQAIMRQLRGSGTAITAREISKQCGNCHPALNALEAKGLIERRSQPTENRLRQAGNTRHPVTLNRDQQHAINCIASSHHRYQPFLLNGVTGSGKTEVYIHSLDKFLKFGQQALILLPEIGLTPQFIERFQQQLNVRIAVLHSALTDNERLQAWLMARDGGVKVVIGTRSALWTPFKDLGIIVIDEEHDPSFKQQEGFRYSARDMAIARAQRENIPVVLGSATPALESVFNASRGRYQEILLPQRAGPASLPDIRMIDLRRCGMDGALSLPLLDAISQHLGKKEQVLLFLNRRGYAPVLMCHDCGWVSRCPRCDMHMTFHKPNNKLCCHHCGREEKRLAACSACGGGNFVEIGYGTQRITETLAGHFPRAGILRIDRDSTRRKGAMQYMLDDIQSGGVDILIGTQMLAKGHHFPGVTLVGIIDADRGLYSADFRAAERMGQIIMQVSGRAGRAEKPGVVLIQTHHPDHPLLQTLAQHDYGGYTSQLLRERKETMLPPFTHQALLRAEANSMMLTHKFLQRARARLPEEDGIIEILGPVPAPMEKRAGYYRMQLLLQAKNRAHLRNLLDSWIASLEQLPEARKVRWSLDVDPLDLL